MWTFCLPPDATWHPFSLPAAWEELNLPEDFCGPVWFRALMPLPPHTPHQRVWLRFQAVSYHCEVYVNGKWIGAHTGAWDPFSLDITPTLDASSASARVAEILVQVTKPASLTAGPDSPSFPGLYPLRETLAGFLPYVWGHAFGGLWQPVELYTTGPTYIEDAFIRADAQGHFTLDVTLSAPSPLHLQILDPNGQDCLSTSLLSSKTHLAAFTFPDILLWSPAHPALYTAHLTLPEGDQKTLRFGFRTLSTKGSSLCLNNMSIYPRFILSWGWYPPRKCPDPGPERIRIDFAHLKDMGFNGVKLCLWFPPPYLFDLADEMGLLLWVEFPLWLPKLTEFFRAQTPLELERLARLARQHPSVILYTLGCELGGDLDASFLETLTARIKPLVGDALLAGNSGSGEAYGGPLQETTDFYDHHFYTDLPFLPGLLDTFAPQWRTPKPWLMGEFCDFDTLRDWAVLLENPEKPRWLTRTSQGARWAMEVYSQETRLKALGLWAQVDKFHQLSRQKALLHRKRTLEIVRARPALSGYVITGEVDTPIATAGLWDDLGRPKFDPEDFRSFNGETVPLLGFRRWRVWEAGGDRPAFTDRFCVFGGEVVRVAMVVSHFGEVCGPARYTWGGGFAGGAPFATGEGISEYILCPGGIQEVGDIVFGLPEIMVPCPVDLRVDIRIEDAEMAWSETDWDEKGREKLDEGEQTIDAWEDGSVEFANQGMVGEDENPAGKKLWQTTTVTNTWRFWLFPKDVWAGVSPFAVDDPGGRLEDLLQAYPGLCRRRKARGRVAVVTHWSAKIARWVRAGGRAVVLQGRAPGPIPVVKRPFWRECIQIGVPHPAWGRFPVSFGEQYEALGTDLALATAYGQGVPLLRRLDTRQIVMEDYAVELKIGQGRIILTTLRLDGGLGDQPSGITRSPAGLFLLAEWVRYLQSDLFSLP